MSLQKRYLYICYCGPVRLREDQKDKHPGYIYENCPRISAPMIKTPKLSELKDYRMTKFYKNIDCYIDKMINLGVTRSELTGSFVRQDQSFTSDIDIIVSHPDEKNIKKIESVLKDIDKLGIDLISQKSLDLMPHMSIDKGTTIVLFDLKSGYRYHE
jgi:predicted nucleotidyltransferase